MGISQNFSALLQGMTRLTSVHLSAETAQSRPVIEKGSCPVTTITTTDGTEIYHKDWGTARRQEEGLGTLGKKGRDRQRSRSNQKEVTQ